MSFQAEERLARLKFNFETTSETTTEEMNRKNTENLKNRR